MPGWLILAVPFFVYISQIILDNRKKGTATTTMSNTGVSSLDTPPFPLLALFSIVIFYLYLSTYFSYKEELHRAFFQLKLLLLVLPALLIFIMRQNYSPADESRRWYVPRLPKPEPGSIHRAGGSPWGVALLVVVLLVMVSYHSAVGAHWFRPLWYTHYYR